MSCVLVIYFLSLLISNGYAIQVDTSQLNCWPPPKANHSIIKLSTSEAINDTKVGKSFGGFLPGSRIHYHCIYRNDHELRKPDSIITCRNGSWIGTQPSCKRRYQDSIDKMNPGVKAYKGCILERNFYQRVRASKMQLKGGIYPDGTRLRFSCFAGRLYPGYEFVSCINGRWNRTIPLCVVSRCGLPENVRNGSWTVIEHNRHLPIVQSGKLLESVRIEYDCDNGFNLVGSKSRKCLSNGEWSGEKGVCVPSFDLTRVCPPISPPNHGRLTCFRRICRPTDPMAIGTVIFMSCDVGYVPFGNEVTLRCIFPDGPDSRPRWNRRKLKCVTREELMDMNSRGFFGNGSLWSQDLTVVIVVSTVVMGSLLMIFTAVVACRCVRHATNGRRGRASSPLHHHHHHPYTVSTATVGTGHRNEDCVALIVPPSYEEAIREGGPMGPHVSMGTAGPASMTVDGMNSTTMSNSRGGPPLTGSRLAHVLSRSPRIRSSGESRDYRPLQAPFGSRQSRRAAANSASMGNNQQQPFHHHGNIPASAGEADSVSRHSTQTSGSHGPAYCLSGSLETMAVSDGTSVTLRTYESQHGSNPSLISTRPQTGSLCEPQQSCQSSQQQQSTNRGGVETSGVIVGSMTSNEPNLPVRTASQAPNGTGNVTGFVTSGSIVGSEKEDSISTRS